jgi:hypothetical protein
MATKKTTGEPKAKDAPAAKKAGVKATAAKETPQTAKPAKAAPQAKPAAAKKAAAPAKLSGAQSELLSKIGAADAAGYLGTKKAEQRTIEALAARKLVKKGAKDKASGNYRYLISSAGKKHLAAQPAATAPAAAAPAPATAVQPAAPAPPPAPAPTP